MAEPEWVFDWQTTEQDLTEWESLCGPRKYRLYVIACYREILPLLIDERSRQAIAVAEQYADGLVSRAELQTAFDIAELASLEAESNADFSTRERAAMTALLWVAAENAELMESNLSPTGFAVELMPPEKHDVGWRLWLDVYGPRKPVQFAPEWQTDTALSLARQMYESRDFSAMPILADALQDAGCDNDDILNHCRDEKQVHVRGCWVVDLVLGKS